MRVSLFVDGANMFYTQRNKLKWWIDWKKFLDHIRGTDTLTDAFYYTGVRVPPEARDQSFLDFLAYSGYSVQTKQLKDIVDEETGEAHQKANLDIEIVMDMFNTIDAYDKAVLASGDGDFERALALLRGRGKRFLVVSTDGFVSMDLRRVAGAHFLDLNTIRAAVEKGPPAKC